MTETKHYLSGTLLDEGPSTAWVNCAGRSA